MSLRSLRVLARFWNVRADGKRLVSATAAAMSQDLPGRPLLTQSFYHQPSSDPLLSLTMGEVVERAARLAGDKTAHISHFQGIRKTFTEIDTESTNLAAGLVALGFERGDRLALWSPNSYQWIVILFAAAKAGLVLVNINPAYQVPELSYVLNKVHCKGIIAPESFKTQKYYDMICNLVPELPTAKPGQLQGNSIPLLQHVICISEQASPGTWSLGQVMSAAGSDAFRKLEDIKKKIRFDDPVNIQFTSGTTGKSKAAILSHFNMVNNAKHVVKNCCFGDNKQSVLMQVPLFHCYGCVVSCLGPIIDTSTSILPSPIFLPELSLQAIQSYKASVVIGTPTMYVDLIRQLEKEPDKYDISSVNHLIFGGSTCPPELMIKVKKIFRTERIHDCDKVANGQQPFRAPNIMNGYGCTETSPCITVNNGLNIDKVFTVGYAVEHIQIKVIDKEGDILPVNTPGEICVRGYNVFKGYYEDEEKTREAIDEDNWYHTGDICTMDEEGYVSVIGRLKDMIIRGGENIYPVEIEDFFLKHPAVDDVHVVGVPDERMGEEVCACFRLRKGHKATEQELKEYCKGKLSHYKIPRYMMFMDSFPTLMTGKVPKNQLRAIVLEKLQAAQ